MARKILLADDSVTAQNMGRKILADAGYEVITVNNGSAALKKIGEQRPDLIVLDVYMPGYSGLEVCQRVKEVGDTSRIPILLTVGKLEPFKPEEAKRVRADGYIVKPFEASELLSALSKLEDKIVPRNEPSKPGRFGRIAAAEDARFDKTMVVEEDSGWKNRIAFPSKKKEKEKEPEPEETVVPIAAKNARTEFREMAVEAPAAQKSEGTVDLGALANAGLPKDVTPEEIAALAAAAARIKGKIAEPNRDEPASEIAAVQAGSSEAPAPAPEAAATEVVSESKESETKAAAEPEQVSSAVGHSQDSTEEQSVTAAIAPSSQEVPEAAGEPVTMAAAAAVGQSFSHASRWTAVSVALAPEETGISLEEEMQKAYAEFAAAETGHAGSITADSLNSSFESAPISASVPATVAPEALQDLSAVGSAAAEAVTAAVKELEQVASAYAAQGPAHVQSAMPEFSVDGGKTVSEEPAVESPAASDSQSAKQEAAHVEDSISSQEAAAESAAPSETAPDSVAAQPLAESSEPLAAKASAAIVETPAQDTAAMAAAVGGKPVEESSFDTDPAIASIVDSVLANLRPKIVEEISRKLGRK
ncbi:MAG: response regulator [Candidatus Sulfotelmatobacter sp.]